VKESILNFNLTKDIPLPADLDDEIILKDGFFDIERSDYKDDYKPVPNMSDFLRDMGTVLKYFNHKISNQHAGKRLKNL
jgi:hypothetical protein